MCWADCVHPQDACSNGAPPCVCVRARACVRAREQFFGGALVSEYLRYSP